MTKYERAQRACDWMEAHKYEIILNIVPGRWSVTIIDGPTFEADTFLEVMEQTIAYDEQKQSTTAS